MNPTTLMQQAKNTIHTTLATARRPVVHGVTPRLGKSERDIVLSTQRALPMEVERCQELEIEHGVSHGTPDS